MRHRSSSQQSGWILLINRGSVCSFLFSIPTNIVQSPYAFPKRLNRFSLSLVYHVVCAENIGACASGGKDRAGSGGKDVTMGNESSYTLTAKTSPGNGKGVDSTIDK